MRKLVVAALLACALPIAKGWAKMTSDEAEVLAREQEFLSAWRAGDAHAAAAVYAEDGLRVGAFGDVQRGRAEIEASYRKLFSGPMSGATIDITPTARLLSRDVALVEGPMTIHPPGGGKPIAGYALDVWKKSGGRWWLVEGHPKFLATRP